MNDQYDYVACLEQGCESWRKGDDLEGIGWFQQACLLWLDHLEQEALKDDQASSEVQATLANLFTKLMTYLENYDIAMATDVLEYEILPLIKPKNS